MQQALHRSGRLVKRHLKQEPQQQQEQTEWTSNHQKQTTKREQMHATEQQSIHRARSQLLVSSPNGIMSSELPQASNNGTQQVGRQRRKSMSNDEPNNKANTKHYRQRSTIMKRVYRRTSRSKKTASNRMAASNKSDYYIKQANQNNSRINSSVQLLK